MPANHNGEPLLRSAFFSFFLTISLASCVSWSYLPSLESSPFLRIALFASQGFAMLGLVFFFPKSSNQNAIRLILLSAILLRALLWPAAVSDDVNRYLWEAKIVVSGENPYIAPADDPRWESRQDTVWEGMNHRDRPTAYPPGIQWIMAATVKISPHLKSFKALALIGDLATLLLLFQLLKQQAAPLRWAGFYAFNPIVLIGFAAEAHFDSLMIAALLFALLAAAKEKKSAWFWLCVAIQIKLVCLILIPLFLTKRSLRSVWILPLVLIIPSLPFLSALPEWFGGVRQFASSGAFNAPLFSLLAGAGLDLQITLTLCLITFGISTTAIWILRWRGLPLIDASLWMLSALLICSPIVHFWYVAWLLPLIALRPSFAWTILSITMAGYFLAWHTQETEGWWGFRHATAVIIWLPFLLAAIAQNRFALSKRKTKRTENFSSNEKISLILPVLKPDPALLPLLKTLRQELGVAPEILIISAEKSDFHCPEKTINAPRGRGNQIAAGISESTGDWILIVHSDSTPRPGFLTEIKNAIQTHPQTALFVFGQRFDKGNLGTLLVEAMNEIRVVFGGVAFGDQTMLIRRSALEAAGGFPAQPLMEDVEVSMRLATQGRIIYLGTEWNVSARKWSGNFIKRFTMVIRLVASYQIARLRSRQHAAKVSEKMYHEYYPE